MENKVKIIDAVTGEFIGDFEISGSDPTAYNQTRPSEFVNKFKETGMRPMSIVFDSGKTILVHGYINFHGDVSFFDVNNIQFCEAVDELKRR